MNSQVDEKFLAMKKRLMNLGVKENFIDVKYAEWREKRDTLLNELINDEGKRKAYTNELNSTLKSFQDMVEGESAKDLNVAKELDRYTLYQEGKMSEDDAEEYGDEIKTKPSIMQIVTDHARYASEYKTKYDTLLVAQSILGYNILTKESAKDYNLIE
jgi:hypothetical protein